MDQSNEFSDSDPFSSPTPPLLPPPPPPPLPLLLLPTNTPIILALPPLATYPSREALFDTIQAWARLRGYAFSIARSKKTGYGRYKLHYACDRRAQVQPTKRQNRVRDTQSRGSGCLFSILAIELPNSLGWEVRYRPGVQFNTHNHPPSQSPAAHPSHRRLPITAQNTHQSLFLAGNN
jgi:hypothetical protein